MKLLTVLLVFATGLLVGSEAPAEQTFNCGTADAVHREEQRRIKPRVQPIADDPPALPVIHRTTGLRTAGHGTRHPRSFPLRAAGHLCGTEDAEAGASRSSLRSRVSVSFATRAEDWKRKIRITVDRTTSFRIIIDSGSPASFDAFEFVDVLPGKYVFTLDSLDSWRGPVDVALEHHGRIIGTRTVYARVMTHPAREYPSQWKTRAPRGTLASNR